MVFDKRWVAKLLIYEYFLCFIASLRTFKLANKYFGLPEKENAWKNEPRRAYRASLANKQLAVWVSTGAKSCGSQTHTYVCSSHRSPSKLACELLLFHHHHHQHTAKGLTVYRVHIATAITLPKTPWETEKEKRSLI
jgi:hypothetical protein